MNETNTAQNKATQKPSCEVSPKSKAKGKKERERKRGKELVLC